MIDNIFVLWLLVVAVVGFALIVAMPTVIAFFISRWLTRRGIRYVGLLLVIIAPIWTAYEVYTAVYPTDSFYLSELEKVTLREAPKSATIINKYASYPDLHGDYCSVSLITLSSEDYSALLNGLINDKRLTRINRDEIVGSRELEEILGGFKKENIAHHFTLNINERRGDHLYIGFLDDRKTIVVNIWVM